MYGFTCAARGGEPKPFSQANKNTYVRRKARSAASLSSLSFSPRGGGDEIRTMCVRFGEKGNQRDAKLGGGDGH